MFILEESKVLQVIQKETEKKSSEEYKSKHDIEFQLSCLLISLIEHFSYKLDNMYRSEICQYNNYCRYALSVFTNLIVCK